MTLHHPRLAHALMALRPGARPNVDFIVEDRGEGPVLREGSMQDPPSQDEVDAVTAEQLDAAQLAKRPVVPALEFLDRLTDEEYAAVIAAAEEARAGGDVQLSRWIDAVRVNKDVDVRSARVLAAKAALIEMGLISAERAEVIFAG